jgi:transcriptional regulator with PAS, ATPase and Fis domain
MLCPQTIKIIHDHFACHIPPRYQHPADHLLLKNKNAAPMNIRPRFQINFFHVLLILLGITSIIPIFILSSRSLKKLDEIEKLSNETSEIIVRDQTAQLSITEAQHIAQDVANLFRTCEMDLNGLALLPIDNQAYLRFWHSHKRGNNFLQSSSPLYKEIAFIDRLGKERVRIADGEIVPAVRLRNVSNPRSTTFRSETYFTDTINSPTGIHVTHLTGWYVSRPEQLNQGKSYDGVIRFCKKMIGAYGEFAGIWMVALDHHHLMSFIDKNSKVPLLDLYKSGNYKYIIDDEGWIIAHPKLWDIRGLDRDGNLVESFTEKTPDWKIDAGLIPQNLQLMDWRLRDIYTDEPMSSIIKRIQRGETAVYTMKSTGIHKLAEGIIRTRACAPIVYDSGVYEKHSIAGGVVVGIPMENLVAKTKSFTAEVEAIGKNTRNYMIMLASVLSLLVLFLYYAFASSINGTVIRLTQSLQRIGQGDYLFPDVNSPIKEITELFSGVRQLSVQLQEKDDKISQFIKNLELVNKQLAAAQIQLDSYWKHEYEIETAQVLKEKISLYERDYPELVEIRKNLNVGASQQFLRVLRQIVPLSQMTIPAWIYGETGVGKTALARTMHMLSPRKQNKLHIFEAIEFSAADPMIVMGKLFGFGGSHGLAGIDKNGQKGILEQCDGGTLIIDDVDALPLDTQAQLLRVVDGHSYHPAAGKTRDITSDIRFIFISNVDLEQKVREGTFRKDLFRRMGGNINKIEIPPLRERKSDIPVLARYFVAKYNARSKAALGLSEAAVALLMTHDYREGNIGELRMITELAYENTRIEGKSQIAKEDFPHFAANHKEIVTLLPDNFCSPLFNDLEKRIVTTLRTHLFRMEMAESALGYQPGSHTLSHHLRGICLKALAHSGYDIAAAVKMTTGTGHGKIHDVVEAKILGYINNIRDKMTESQTLSLYKHLPKEYHPCLDKAIDHYGH